MREKRIRALIAGTLSLFACSSPTPAPTPESDEVRYEKLLAAYRIGPRDDLTASEVVSIYDFVMRVEDGQYASCNFSINKAGEGQYLVLALNGYGSASGWQLEIEAEPEGFRLVQSIFSPCFY